MKRFTMQDLIKHHSIGSGQRNLVELISRYPGFGQHFKVFKKTWPADCYYKIKRVELYVSFLDSLLSVLERTLRPFSCDQVLERRDSE